MSPTSDLNVTTSLAVAIFIYYNVQGLRRHGIKYFAHFFGPPLPWYFFPLRLLLFLIEVISHLARPFSLALRLFCNIFSKEILLGLLALLAVKFFFGQGQIERGLTIVPLLLRPFIILLGLMIGFIQALIFTVLSIAYVAGAVRTEEH
jgi:F-type H+-transporting ATPase subunit a